MHESNLNQRLKLSLPLRYARSNGCPTLALSLRGRLASKVMLQPYDKAVTGFTDDHTSAMVATHAGTLPGPFSLTHQEPQSVTSNSATPISGRCSRCYSCFTATGGSCPAGLRMHRLISLPLPVSTNNLSNVIGAAHNPRDGRADYTRLPVLYIRQSQIIGIIAVRG